MSKKLPNYKIPFALNGDMMDYEDDEYPCIRNYDEATGECELRSGRYGEPEKWDKINLKSLGRPFTATRSQYSNDGWHLRLSPEMRDVYVFEDVLSYVGYGKGRSAVHFTFEDSQKRRYNMFISEFSELVNTQYLECGITPKLRWTFVKKGSNYSIKLA